MVLGDLGSSVLYYRMKDGKTDAEMPRGRRRKRRRRREKKKPTMMSERKEEAACA